MPRKVIAKFCVMLAYQYHGGASENSQRKAALLLLSKFMEEIRIQKLAELEIARTNSASTIQHVSLEQVYGPDFEDMTRRVADTSKLEAVTGFRCEIKLIEILDAMIRSARESLMAS